MVVEVGPLARVMVAVSRNKDSLLNEILGRIGRQLGIGPEALDSTMGRHAARAIECKYVADQCAQWVAQLKPDAPSFTDFSIPSQARGVGLTEAPRGALGHWLEIEGYKISRYQCVVPTTWNCSPRDDKGNPGAVEQALVGTPVADAAHPIEATRVVRAFDPCIACAVH
jgi:ferredoxin hydrogenase large subunit/hydrogenase large subunit